MIISIDTGGTFTDFIYRKDNDWHVYKCLSTPADPARAVLSGIEHVACGSSIHIVHGSTVATNALLEKKGAKTALITNKGFEDILEIGRQHRTNLYALKYKKATPLVAPNLRFGVGSRVDSSGAVITSLDASEIESIIDTLHKGNVESIAVSLLFSFIAPDPEKTIGMLLTKDNFSISLSHEILAEFREFERISTVVINAYVLPIMKRYLSSLSQQIGNKLRIMQSNGGSISAETAQKEAVRTILSGPAGGVVGAYDIAKRSGYPQLITFDMGGTSTDVALIEDRLPITSTANIAGYPVSVPMIDIHTVGAGGGSIACIDDGGALTVGPQSAGASPGPICYGKGTEITVTDANLYLGRLLPHHFLGGNMRLHPERLDRYFGHIAGTYGMTPIEFAEGVLAVANATMEKAIRVISVEKGFDPRDFILFSYGGAGGLHAAFLAASLKIPKVMIPPHPGALSAMGMLEADISKDYSHTVMLLQSELKKGMLEELFSPFEKKGRSALILEGVEDRSITIERYLDMRYLGQSHELTIFYDDDVYDRFHHKHLQHYGYKNDYADVQIVNIRLRVNGIWQKNTRQRKEIVTKVPPADAQISVNDVIFNEKNMTTPVYERQRLLNGNRLIGPALIIEYSSTTVIPPLAACTIDAYDNIVINVTDT